MHKTLSMAFVLGVVALSLAACQSVVVPKVENKEVPELALDVQSRYIAFRKLRLKVPRTHKIGSFGKGLLCTEYAKIKARRGNHGLPIDDLNEIFIEELQRHNFNVVGDPDALFDDPTLDRAEYFIAGVIRDLKLNTCQPLLDYGNERGNGEAYLEVEWRLWDPFRKRVVYTTKSAGSSNVTGQVQDPAIEALEDAFAMATQNLLADVKFVRHLTVESGASAARKRGRFDPFTIKEMRPLFTGSFDALAVKPGVVTIKTATGHGSGFFVSSDGFILTNQHVVGGAKTVRVILHSGRELVAEVVRRDPVRDVALLLVGETGFEALPVTFAEPPVGSTVLVYGTPRFEELSGTLTRGIVSAYRFEKPEGRLIQSDVTVHGGNSGGPLLDDKGNVIGLTVSGVVDKAGGSIGLNYFIPIKDAFEALSLRVPHTFASR